MADLENSEVGLRQQMILQCIWEAGGEAKIKEIIDRIEEKCGTRLASSSVNTMLLLLVDKGLVEKVRRVSHAYVYRVLVDEEVFRREEVRRLRAYTFKGSSTALISSLLGIGMTPAERKEAIRLLKEWKEE